MGSIRLVHCVLTLLSVQIQLLVNAHARWENEKYTFIAEKVSKMPDVPRVNHVTRRLTLSR